MSLPLLPFTPWVDGTDPEQPWNDNVLRAAILGGVNVNNATTAQPSLTSPADDYKAYIIQSTHTGAQWATFTPKSVAIFVGGGWYEFTPVEGARISVGGVPYIYTASAWASTGGGGGSMTNPMTAVADLIVGSTVTGGVAAPARLAKGTAYQVLRMNSGATAQEWGGALLAIPIACSDETTALTAGSAKVTFRMPFAMNNVTVRGSLTTAQATGSIFTVDINESGASILSTKLTIDNTEKTSTTAATPAVVSDSSLADDAEITIDVDQIGDGTAKGLKVYLIGTPA